MEGSSSSQHSRSKTKSRPVGPIQIHTDGKPFGLYYDALTKQISEHVFHCDQFNPALTWTDLKNTGNVEALYKELTPVFTLPDWSDQGQIAIKFRKWFNSIARHRFNDNKWRTLYRTYERCKRDGSVHVPPSVDSETWAALCQAYEKNAEEDESGMSMHEKRKASRGENELNHHLGRDSLSVWCGKFRATRNKSPNAKEIYNKEFLKRDALKASEGLPNADPRGASVSPGAPAIGIRLEQAYDAAIAEGSDESTAGTRAVFETFGRITRLGMEAPSGSRPAGRKNTYTTQLEEKVQNLTQQSELDRKRIQDLERMQYDMQQNMQQSQREMQQNMQREMQSFMAQFMASQQGAGGGDYYGGGRGDGGDTGGGGYYSGGRGDGGGGYYGGGRGDGGGGYYYGGRGDGGGGYYGGGSGGGGGGDGGGGSGSGRAGYYGGDGSGSGGGGYHGGDGSGSGGGGYYGCSSGRDDIA